jgi:hypothetical protein
MYRYLIPVIAFFIALHELPVNRIRSLLSKLYNESGNTPELKDIKLSIYPSALTISPKMAASSSLEIP